jgi:hypothetical protein
MCARAIPEAFRKSERFFSWLTFSIYDQKERRIYKILIFLFAAERRIMVFVMAWELSYRFYIDPLSNLFDSYERGLFV